MAEGKLALHGGPKVRKTPMPRRKAFGPDERRAVEEAMEWYASHDAEIAYEGEFERRYCRAFEAFQGGGHADAVATGTGSCWVALAALDLPPGSEVILSPIVDAGPLNAIILQGHVPVLADSAPRSFNVGVEQFLARVTSKTKALFLVHALGQPAEIDVIEEAARARGIKVLEDCSQAHGARVNGRRVGTFGDVAAFSAMFKKSHIMGSSGGVVYSTDLETYRRGLLHADRGRPRWRDDFDERSPRTNLFPALNWNADELSCAVGNASLARLDVTIARRLAFVRRLEALVRTRSRACTPIRYSDDASPFACPMFVDEARVSCDARTFGEAVRAEGIDLNPHYGFLVRGWPYALPHLGDHETPNARALRDGSFILYLNENYAEAEAEDTIRAIEKVERHYAR